MCAIVHNTDIRNDKPPTEKLENLLMYHLINNAYLKQTTPISLHPIKKSLERQD